MPAYVEQIRQAISHGAEEGALSSSHVNAANFWRAAYEKSEMDKTRLLDKIFELEQQGRRTGPGTKRQRDSPSTPRTNTKSRRRRLEDVGSLPDTGRLVDQADLGDFNICMPHMRNSSFQHLTLADPRTFLRGIFAVSRALAGDVSDTGNVVSALRGMCQSLASGFAGGDHQVTGNDPGNTSHIPTANLCTVFARSYSTMLHALAIISSEERNDGNTYFPGVVDVVYLFRAVLGCLHKQALDEATRRKEQAKQKMTKPRGRDTKTGNCRSHDALGRFTQDSQAIVGAVVQFIADVDVSTEAHCQLLEGLLCSLLDHIGTALSLLVFADRSAPSLTEQPSLVPPRGLGDNAHLPLDTAISTAEIEAPYLAFVLRKAMAFLHDGEPRVMSALFSIGNTGVGGQSGLRRRIQERLQNTLLRGVFGDDDETFHDSLRRADDVGNVDLVQILEEMKSEEDVTEWFVGELWEQLGWGVLSGRVGI